jgi:uncharacterized protein YjbJ (UPF0337 family)
MDTNHIHGAAKSAEGTIKEAAGDITGDAKTKVEGKMDQAEGTIRSTYADAKDKIKGAADTVSSQASDIGGQVYDAGARAGKYVGETIKEQPLAALLITGIIGYAIGFLIHSSSSPFVPEPEPLPRRYVRQLRGRFQ